MKNGDRDEKRQQQVRMDNALIARVQKFQARLRDKSQLEVSFSSACRSLIERGLQAEKL